MGEVDVERPGGMKEHRVIFRPVRLGKRRILQRSLGCHVVGRAPPCPDVYDVETLMQGCQKRFLRETPPIDRAVLRRLREFSRWLARKLIRPLELWEIDFEEWLHQAPYPEWRKKEIREAWDNCLRTISKRHFKNKSFGKHEHYVQEGAVFKNARAINSRTDAFKAWSGPFFHALEKKLFATEWFIKHVPVNERPAWLLKKFGQNRQVVATDHSSFEAHVTSEIIMAVEWQLYAYAFRNVLDGGELALLRRALAGTNECAFKDFTVYVRGCRMSGDMCTSLGNGWTNLVVMLYLKQEYGGEDVLNIPGVVEGDDGLFAGYEPSPVQFATVGMTVKQSHFPRAGDAGFCGLMFDEIELKNITDPRDKILRFGWTMSTMMYGKERKLRGLLRAKALSLVYETPHCPILSAMGRAYVRLTHGTQAIYDPTEYTTWWQTFIGVYGLQSDPCMNYTVGPGTRICFERLYGVSVGMQLEIENYFDNLSNISPIDHAAIESLLYRFPQTCQYYQRYTTGSPL